MLEPGAAPPIKRLEILQQLKEAGFLTGVNAIPVLPFISDTEAELEKIVAPAQKPTKQIICWLGIDFVWQGGCRQQEPLL